MFGDIRDKSGEGVVTPLLPRQPSHPLARRLPVQAIRGPQVAKCLFVIKSDIRNGRGFMRTLVSSLECACRAPLVLQMQGLPFR